MALTYIKRGAPAAAISDPASVTVTWTAGTITADAAVTIADGDQATTGENLEFITEVNDKVDDLVTAVNSIIAALEANGTLTP